MQYVTYFLKWFTIKAEIHESLLNAFIINPKNKKAKKKKKSMGDSQNVGS